MVITSPSTPYKSIEMEFTIDMLVTASIMLTDPPIGNAELGVHEEVPGGADAGPQRLHPSGAT
jgi:hypothetical protein